MRSVEAEQDEVSHVPAPDAVAGEETVVVVPQGDSGARGRSGCWAGAQGPLASAPGRYPESSGEFWMTRTAWSQGVGGEAGRAPWSRGRREEDGRPWGPHVWAETGRAAAPRSPEAMHRK